MNEINQVGNSNSFFQQLKRRLSLKRSVQTLQQQSTLDIERSNSQLEKQYKQNENQQNSSQEEKKHQIIRRYSRKKSIADRIATVIGKKSQISRQELKSKTTRIKDTDFTINDLKLLQKTIENEQKLLEKELQEITELNGPTEGLVKQKDFKSLKWTKVKKNLLAVARIRRLNEEIRTYGTSVNLLGINLKDFSKLQSSFSENIYQEDIEINKLKKKQKYIFYPESEFLQFWSIIVVFLLVYSAYITPYRIAFMDEVSSSWLLLEYIVDGLFLVDLIVTIRSAYYTQEGLLVEDGKIMFVNYAKSWLFLDLLAIVPFDNLLYEDETNNSNLKVRDVARLARLPRLYRLIRIARIMKMIKRMNKNNFVQKFQEFFQLNPGTIRLIVFFLSISVCIHIVGCLWYYTAKLNDFGPDTWVTNDGLNDSSYFSVYLVCIYWAVSTIATVGLGDIHAYNDLEKIVSIIWMILGAGFYSFTIGSLSGVFANLDTRRAYLEGKISVLDEFSKETKLSKDLQSRIQTSLEYNSLKSIFSQNERDEFLLELSLDLKWEIANSMYQGLTQVFPFFRNRDKGIIANFVPSLQPLKIHQGETIYRIGEYPNHGRINFVVGTNKLVYKSYVQGSYFGEIEIFRNTLRQLTARAEVDSELLYIHRQKFMRILKEYPDFEQELREVALEREQRNLEALRKVQKLIPISLKSKFWDKKRKHSLYDKRRIKKFALLDQNKSLDSNFTEEDEQQQQQESKKKKGIIGILSKLGLRINRSNFKSKTSLTETISEGDNTAMRLNGNYEQTEEVQTPVSNSTYNQYGKQAFSSLQQQSINEFGSGTEEEIDVPQTQRRLIKSQFSPQGRRGSSTLQVDAINYEALRRKSILEQPIEESSQENCEETQKSIILIQNHKNTLKESNSLELNNASLIHSNKININNHDNNDNEISKDKQHLFGESPLVKQSQNSVVLSQETFGFVASNSSINNNNNSKEDNQPQSDIGYSSSDSDNQLNNSKNIKQKKLEILNQETEFLGLKMKNYQKKLKKINQNLAHFEKIVQKLKKKRKPTTIKLPENDSFQACAQILNNIQPLSVIPKSKFDNKFIRELSSSETDYEKPLNTQNKNNQNYSHEQEMPVIEDINIQEYHNLYLSPTSRNKSYQHLELE